MIGKPEWFATRKFGWGLGIKSWQGIGYIMVIALIYGAVYAAPINEGMRIGIAVIVSALIIADMLHIMYSVYSKLDEREEKHQLVAERNAAFTAIAIMIIYFSYLSFSASLTGVHPDLSIFVLPVIVLVGMSVVKGTTLVLLEREG